MNTGRNGVDHCAPRPIFFGCAVSGPQHSLQTSQPPWFITQLTILPHRSHRSLPMVIDGSSCLGLSDSSLAWLPGPPCAIGACGPRRPGRLARGPRVSTGATRPATGSRKCCQHLPVAVPPPLQEPVVSPPGLFGGLPPRSDEYSPCYFSLLALATGLGGCLLLRDAF